jgi:hypothetical protein
MWADVSQFAGITTLIDGTAGGTVAGTLQMQFSHDGSTVHRSISVVTDDITNTLPRTLGVVAKYYRIIFTADSDLTSFDAQVMFHTEQVSLVSRLDSTLQGTEDVTVNRSVGVGSQPLGTYKDNPANGVAVTTSGTLASGASYTSAWVDTHGYNVIELAIITDVVSSYEGICIQFTSDLDNPQAEIIDCYTFTDEDILQGFKSIVQSPKLVGFRIHYVNGPTAQGSLTLQVDLKTNGTATTRIDQTIRRSEDVLLVRDGTDFILDASRENIEGVITDQFFGFNTAVGASYEDIHPNGGDINWQTVASGVAISSSHTADASGGLGVRSVELHGLSATGENQDEVILLNGTTEVESALTYIRVNKLHSETCGTYGGSHQGDITCRMTSAGAKTGNVMAIMVGDEGAVGSSVQYGLGEAGNGYWSVPLGKVMYITRIQVIPDVASNKTVDIALYEREDLLTISGDMAPRRVVWAEKAVDSEVSKEFPSHLKIKPLADLFFRASATASTEIEVYVDFYLVDENANGK